MSLITTKSYFFPTEDEMLVFAGQLATHIKPGTTLFLQGPLGAGKTTFTRGFLRGLGFTGKVKSPTYTLVEPYELPHHQIFHFDFYRLTDPQELEQMGIRDYFSEKAICLIEWPENGFPLLPPPDLTCYIDFKESGRDFKIEALSKRGEGVLEKME